MVAASVSITYKDKIIFTWNGGQDNRTQLKPTADSPYRIGSLSKIFPWLLVLVAESKGLISVDDPVRKTVPDFNMIDGFHSADSGYQTSITWRQIASQLSGVPREAPCPFAACAYTTEEMLARLQKVHLILPPETRPSYSNLGFGLLGRVVAERILKSPSFEQACEDLILKPLGMANTTWFPPFNIVPPVPSNRPYTDMGWTGPAGNAVSTVNDIARLAIFFNQAASPKYTFPNMPRWLFPPVSGSAHQQRRSTENKAPLKNRPSSLGLADNDVTPLGIRGEAIRRTFSPSFVNFDGTGFGTPWEITQTGVHLIRNKAGNIDGYAADMALIPELQLSFNVITNLASDGAKWATDNLEYFVPRFESILTSYQPIPAGPNNSSLYAGYYEPATTILNVLGVLSIVELNGRRTSIPLVPATFAPYDPTLLQFYIPEYTATMTCMLNEETALAYSVVQFKFDQNGNVLSFSLPGNGYGLEFVKVL